MWGEGEILRVKGVKLGLGLFVVWRWDRLF